MIELDKNLLEIIFENEELIAINKPHGLLVHRTKLAIDANIFAIQWLRDQVGYRVYPTHRIDRKTSGVLLFAKSNERNKDIQSLFRARQVKKSYLAIVRGFIAPEGTIDYPLQNGTTIQEALTQFERLDKFEIDLPSAGHKTSRYSLVRLKPSTGRHHQLRKHMAHIFHPIIGDRPHGCNKQNKLWKEKFDFMTMLLHAESLEFNHNGKLILIKAGLSDQFNSAIEILKRYNVSTEEIKHPRL